MRHGLTMSLALSGWMLATHSATPNLAAAVIQTVGWVPFTASYVTTIDGRVLDRGRYQRATDGSTRSERFTDSYRSIAIINIRQRAYFLYRDGAVSRGRDGSAEWTRQPLALPPQGWMPPQAHSGVEAVSEKVAGYPTFRRRTRGGGYNLVAPDLNWFALVVDLGPGAPRTEFFDVVPGEPDASVFELPHGAVARELSTPGGIVTSTP